MAQKELVTSFFFGKLYSYSDDNGNFSFRIRGIVVLLYVFYASLRNELINHLLR